MTAHPLIVGTAGHIDHGKTALVQALTGIDTDRLPVEKQRGITTELGFAHLDLDGRRVAVVDVPGHERFIKSMVAGAVGIDLVVLVIAADEGVMPQTREHLDICQLLGVRRGLVALTKRDLVDDDWLAMVEADVRGFLAGSFLAGAPLVPVSARTGAGLDDLRARLAAELAALPPRPAAGVLRLPLDRVFTIRGFGTVVTGTVASGAIAAGDEIAIAPRDLAARVRGLEVHGQPATDARAGQRCAVNLVGVATDELARGDVVVHPGAVEPSHILDVRFRLLPSVRAPLPRRSKLLVHHGTAQVNATLVLVGADALAPGDEAIAQLRLDAATPLVALPGDRFIARGFVAQHHHGTTVGGGTIVRVLAAKVRGGGADQAALLRRLADARLAERIPVDVAGAGAAGLTAAALAHRTGQPPAALAPILDELVAGGDLLRAAAAGGEGVYLAAAVVADLERRAVDHVDAFQAAAPHREGMPREELRARLPAALPAPAFDALLAALAASRTLEPAGDVVRRPRTRGPSLSALEASLLERFQIWGLEPPRPREVAAATGNPEAATRAALDRLLAARLIVKIKPDLYLDAARVEDLRGRLLRHLDAHGQISPQEWKELTGTSRKYSIPLAEYFDAEKVTLRVGDLRRRR